MEITYLEDLHHFAEEEWFATGSILPNGFKKSHKLRERERFRLSSRKLGHLFSFLHLMK